MGVLIASSYDLPTSSRRYIDRSPVDGRLWVMIVAAAQTLAFWYSDDNGTTWAHATGDITTTSYSPEALFVDIDGGINVVFYDAGPRYRRGTVSGGTITWGTAVALNNMTSAHDLVVFRNPTEPGWYAMIGGRNTSDNGSHWVSRVRIPETGAPVDAGSYKLTDFVQGGSGFDGMLDFYHTGDGKTVQGGTPHAYAWFNDSYNRFWLTRFIWNGSGYAVWNMQLGTEEGPGLAGMFDGARFMHLTVGDSWAKVHLWERDALNTATVDRGQTPAAPAIRGGTAAMSYDAAGNVYVLIVDINYALYWIKWTRATLEWDAAWTLAFDGTLIAAAPLRAGWAAASWPRIEGVYRDTPSTYYQFVTEVNAAPQPASWAYPADGTPGDVNQQLALGWVFNDPDQGDAQSAYTVRRRIGAGAYNYWNGTAWATSESGATKIVTGTSALTLSANWGTDSQADHYYAVKTWDLVDQESPWSTELRVTPSAKDNPTITTPASDGYDIPTRNFSVVWTVATQTKYRLRVLGDSGGNPDPAVVEHDSGIVIDAAARTAVASFPTNTVVRHIELTTWNDEGLASTLTYRRVDVAWTPPATPTLTLNADDTVPDAIVVDLDNPAGGATVASNDIYRRIIGTTGDGIRIATLVAVDGAVTDYAVAHLVPYEYRVLAISTDGATAWSAWEDGLP